MNKFLLSLAVFASGIAAHAELSSVERAYLTDAVMNNQVTIDQQALINAIQNGDESAAAIIRVAGDNVTFSSGIISATPKPGWIQANDGKNPPFWYDPRYFCRYNRGQINCSKN